MTSRMSLWIISESSKHPFILSVRLARFTWMICASIPMLLNCLPDVFKHQLTILSTDPSPVPRSMNVIFEFGDEAIELNAQAAPKMSSEVMR